MLNKEIQHCVKNNLHMVYSLLQMQERRTDNEEVIEHLQAARLRVESIAALHNQLLTNPHSPGYYRANGPLVNNEAFYRAFGVKEGDKMYRPADQRVVIW